MLEGLPDAFQEAKVRSRAGAQAFQAVPQAPSSSDLVCKCWKPEMGRHSTELICNFVLLCNFDNELEPRYILLGGKICIYYAVLQLKII